MKGILFSFEGPEGSGKSTHIKLLYRYLKRKKNKVIMIREPGQTRIGEKIRKILLSQKYKELAPLTEMLLYMASRNQLMEEVIIPYLKKGYIILCDRFLDSTVVYQGFGLKIDLELIRRIGESVCRGIVPELTIILDVPVDEGLRRVGRNPDRIEKRAVSYHKRVRRGYFKLAEMYPERIKIINANRDIKIVQDMIRKIILEKLCLLGR